MRNYYTVVTASHIEKRKYFLYLISAIRWLSQVPWERSASLSHIIRDQPLTPLQQAVYWTEYVIRHNGAPHLRSAVLDLAWYQYFLLDVTAVLALASVSILLILLLVCRVVLKRLIGWKSHRKNTDSKKKKQIQKKIMCIMLHGDS